MVRSELTHQDRAYAATAGISGTPFTTPPETPIRRSSSADAQTLSSPNLPRSAYLIIFMEGCERFCYYGLKTVLLLYFMHFLSLSKDSATAGYHLFSFACYFTPTIGAIISDGFIGRYWTILILSGFYFAGTLVLTVTAIPSIGGKHLTGPVIGLLLIAFGTGGIKPCVSAFGADQISISNPKQLSRYFAFFYFAINFGSLLSTILTPILRSKVDCFGYDCYALSFGVPAVLMLVAIVIFVLGTPLYKSVPPKENIIVRFVAIIWRAIQNSIFGAQGKREHWLYHADDKYSTNDIEDVRSVLRVCLLFTPIPIFYALYDQSGSRWTYQASLMNGSLGRFVTIQPDQMQALNSLFVLIFIPLFEEVIYPLFARCNLLIRPLQRMFCGMIIMIFAFIAAAIIQQAIQSRANAIPVRYNVQIYNGYHCPIHINYNTILETDKILKYSCTDLLEKKLLFTSTCNNDSIDYSLSIDKICPSVLIVTKIDVGLDGMKMACVPLSNSLQNERGLRESALLRMVSLEDAKTTVKTLPNKYMFNIETKLQPTGYQSVLATKYLIENVTDRRQSEQPFEVYTTAVYTALIHNTNDTKLHVTLFEDVPPFTVHILWQTIQYALMTVAEILVSITGLIFAYSQAPKRYKTVIMSAWLLTTAFGDLIVVLVAEVRLVRNQTWEFILFAILMAFGAFIFGILGIRYREMKPDTNVSEDQQLIIDKKDDDSDEPIPLSNS